MSEEKQLMVPNDDYLKSGIHIGTKFRTKHMENFIYKTRPDGLSVLDIEKIDERLGLAANMISNYEPSEILVVCRRENGWKAVKKFAELTGCRFYAGRYPPGVLTNPSLKNFMETKLLLVVDAWPDRNAIQDAIKIGVPVMAICDTNNQANNIDFVIPGNNKGRKSLGLIFYVLAREYTKNKNIIAEKDFSYTLEDFSDD
ncbi:MAG: 30S ribosomal protein S2 [Candidatus Woesearchaeota archaeon]